jgi:hypothetical protein
LHTDKESARLARNLNASAFTVGTDIAFAEGYYSPNTLEGRRLLAHELTHVIQQSDSNDSRVMRQPLESKIPPEINPSRVSVSFMLPGDITLGGDWLGYLKTTGGTKVTISISISEVTLAFSPALLFDAQFPFGNTSWSGSGYDFTTASISSSLVDESTGFSSQGKASAWINTTINDLLTGTPIAVKGYDPLKDPDMMATLNRIKTNAKEIAKKGGNKEGGVKTKDIGGLEATASITFRKEIRETTDKGGILIPAGGSANITVSFSGSVDDVTNESTRKINSFTIESESIILQDKGSDIAKLQKIVINRGGNVKLGRYKALGTLKDAEGSESFIRLVALLGVLASGTPADRPAVAGSNPELGPQMVSGIAISMIQEALTKAVKKLLQENHNAIPGFDLNDVFGLESPPGDYPLPPKGTPVPA